MTAFLQTPHDPLKDSNLFLCTGSFRRIRHPLHRLRFLGSFRRIRQCHRHRARVMGLNARKKDAAEMQH